MRRTLHANFRSTHSIPTTMKKLTSTSLMNKVHGEGRWEVTPWVDDARILTITPKHVPKFPFGQYIVNQRRSDTTLRETCTAYGIVKVDTIFELMCNTQKTVDVYITSNIEAPIPTTVESLLFDAAQDTLDSIAKFFLH